MGEYIRGRVEKNQKSIRIALLVIYDVFAICAACYLALWIRFDFTATKVEVEYLNRAYTYVGINIISSLLIFIIFQLYHSIWQYASIRELLNIVSACMLSAVTQLIGMKLCRLDMPRSYIPLYALCLILLVAASRFSYRVMRLIRLSISQRNHVDYVRTMIVGAGDAGSMILKEMAGSSYLNNIPVCVIDDDKRKLGKKMSGVTVVGDRTKISWAVEKYDVQEIMICMPSAPAQKRKELVQICQETGCKVRILPGMYQLINEEVSVRKLRDINVEDLLGRDPVKIDLDSVMEYVKDRVVLITGAGGSIGSELSRQIAGYEPKQLILVDIYENTTYDIQIELKRNYPELDLVVRIASVCNEKHLNQIFEAFHPDIVYHAAAHKHVPLMEDSPNEAIRNNVLGTWTLARIADKWKVKRFVMISTDKAVNPTNIMGASKRICEMIIQTYNNLSETEFVAVRFGNVLGSNGSVVPLFQKQIEQGGPVTVTHPDIIRYFMTIPEAVSLVLQAGAYAKGGEIFVLDMGEPVKIVDMARNLIRLSGHKPDEDIQIVYTGLRPGEKLYEEMLMKEEGLQETANRLIHIGEPIEMDKDAFLEELHRLEQHLDQEPGDIREWVRKMVPTYQVQSENEKVEAVAI